MRWLSRVHLAIVIGLAGLAGLLMAGMMVSIVVDVVLRNLGFQSSSHIFTFNEYFLFLIPLLGGPLLVREKGQIYVEVVLMSVSTGLRRRMLTVVLVACTLTCAILAWYSGQVALLDWQRNEIDMRSLDMPRWMLTVWMPVAFTMMALEFARFLARNEDPYARTDGMPARH